MNTTTATSRNITTHKTTSGIRARRAGSISVAGALTCLALAPTIAHADQVTAEGAAASSSRDIDDLVHERKQQMASDYVELATSGRRSRCPSDTAGTIPCTSRRVRPVCRCPPGTPRRPADDREARPWVDPAFRVAHAVTGTPRRHPLGRERREHGTGTGVRPPQSRTGAGRQPRGTGSAPAQSCPRPMARRGGGASSRTRRRRCTATTSRRLRGREHPLAAIAETAARAWPVPKSGGGRSS